MPSSVVLHPSSYRDPSGFIFEKEGILYRQVNNLFKEHFDHFIQSGCYKYLTEKKLLIPHEEIDENVTGDSQYFKTLRPDKIPFISYPAEWSFDMLKDAALLTLRLMKESLEFGLILKDATPYNIQWYKGQLIFIDTLSFEKYAEKPWIAYRQFCENFLGPLLLMHYSKKPLSQLFLAWPDGIPLDITRSLLPKRSRFSFHTYLHIHLHSKISSKTTPGNNSPQHFPRQKLLHLISSLETLVGKLKLPASKSTWSDYYEEAALRKNYIAQKKNIINDWLGKYQDVKTLADLGANEGEFSKLASSKDIHVIAIDSDPYCINKLYSDIKSNDQKNIQPLIADLANPTPAGGVNNKERDSFLSRINTDMSMALALIHHLTIGKNIPFHKIAEMFARISKYLIIEFIPKDDEKVKLMLSNKKDIYKDYSEANFTRAFSSRFLIKERQVLKDSERVLFLMERNQ